MSHPARETAEARKARVRRNWMLAGALIAFVILVFVITIVRLQGNVANLRHF
jgi:hypothetical protein